MPLENWKVVEVVCIGGGEPTGVLLRVERCGKVVASFAFSVERREGLAKLMKCFNEIEAVLGPLR